jgi:hypothetical protein
VTHYWHHTYIIIHKVAFVKNFFDVLKLLNLLAKEQYFFIVIQHIRHLFNLNQLISLAIHLDEDILIGFIVRGQRIARDLSIVKDLSIAKDPSIATDQSIVIDLSIAKDLSIVKDPSIVIDLSIVSDLSIVKDPSIRTGPLPKSKVVIVRSL